MRRKLAHQGHQDTHIDNQGGSDIWTELHTLQEIYKMNDNILGTRHDNLFNPGTLQKRDTKKPQPRGHHPRLTKSGLQ